MEDDKYTWEPIEIRPNDQSLVGEVVKKDDEENFEEKILCVGKHSVFCSDSRNGDEDVYHMNSHWLIRREKPKKTEKRVWAFGWFRESKEHDWDLTKHQITKEMFKSWAKYIVWPAKMSPDGTFTEPDDE